MQEISQNKASDARNWQKSNQFIIRIGNQVFVGTESEWKKSLGSNEPKAVDPKYIKLKPRK
ncbi:MAG: hypothetical protein AAB778_04045 [Patescibacteria group bacterium]